jgi:hypothetical protein
MKETGPIPEFKKGNIDMKVYESDKPISKELIDEHILNFLYSKAGENSELLKVSDFKMEFLVFNGIKGFFKFSIESGNKNSIEVLLTGKEVEDVISLIQQYGSGLGMNPN